MPFHLTITDNETGETVRDLDFDAIIGAVHLSEAMSGGLILSHCSTLALAETVSSAERVVERTLKEDPMLCLAKLVCTATVEEETEETENNQ